MSLHKLKHQHVMFAAFGCLSKLNSWYFSPDGFINSLSMLLYLLWAQLITNKNLSSRCHMIVWGSLLPFPPLSLLFLICSHSLGPVGSLQMLGLEGLYQWKHTAVVCAYGGHLCLQPEWLIFSTVPWQGPKWRGSDMFNSFWRHREGQCRARQLFPFSFSQGKVAWPEKQK